MATIYSSFYAKKTGICLTKAINGVLLNKVFTLSHESLSHCAQGKLLALISQDSDLITEQFGGIVQKSAGIFGMVASTGILLYFIGWVALTGFILMILTLLMNRVFLKLRLPTLQQEESHSDRRIQTITDIIAGIRTIKTYAWERLFLEKVGEVREKQICLARKGS